MKKALLLLLLLSFSLGAAELSDVVKLYENGKYHQAIELGEALISSAETDEEIAIVYQYLGFCYYLVGNFVKARLCFQECLKRSPELELSNEVVLPQIVELFNEVKKEQTPPVGPPKQVQNTPLFIHFLPLGYPQFRQSKPVRGLIFCLTQVILLSISLYAWQRLENEYSVEYNGFVNWRKAREYSLVQKATAIGVILSYLSSVLESLIRESYQ